MAAKKIIKNSEKDKVSYENFKVRKAPKQIKRDTLPQEVKKVDENILDPETKERMYEEARAKLFSPEDVQSCDQCEEEEKKEQIQEANKPPMEGYDIDYDRFWPLFVSQNTVKTNSQPSYYGQQNDPYYNSYAGQQYMPGHYPQPQLYYQEPFPSNETYQPYYNPQ